jgi:plastocyanin
MKGILWIIIIGILAVGGWYAYTAWLSEAPMNSMTSPQEEMQSSLEAGTEASVTDATVRITDSGFTPSSITVVAGTTVTWVNERSRGAWPASAVHPTHTAYPGSGIEKCGTPAAGEIFDACGEVVSGGSYRFTFTEPGTWRYHDHRNVSMTGTVVVEN